MKRLVLVAALTIISTSVASADDSWVNDPSKDLQRLNEMPDLAPSQFVEIPASLAEEAFERLADASAIQLTEKYYPRLNPACAEPSKLYLVRAVYEHGNTGAFHVKQLGHTMWVKHLAMGAAAPRHKSALIVCTEPSFF